jgi:hypothetical protein
MSDNQITVQTPCQIKLAALKNLPEGDAFQLLNMRLTELDRQIVSVQSELQSEIDDSPRIKIARQFRIDSIRQIMVDNILNGKSHCNDMDCIANIKPSRLAELNIILNNLKANRDEISSLCSSLNDDVAVDAIADAIDPKPVSEAPITELKSEDQILAEMKTQIASLSAQ